MKYFLLTLFIFVSTISYSSQFEETCLEIGFEKNTEKYYECVKKLKNRKKPLNKVDAEDLSQKAGLKKDAAIMLGVQVGVSTLATEMATKKIPKSGSVATEGVKNSGMSAESKRYIDLCIAKVLSCPGF